MKPGGHCAGHKLSGYYSERTRKGGVDGESVGSLRKKVEDFFVCSEKRKFCSRRSTLGQKIGQSKRRRGPLEVKGGR